jgi:hypothetical protein
MEDNTKVTPLIASKFIKQKLKYLSNLSLNYRYNLSYYEKELNNHKLYYIYVSKLLRFYYSEVHKRMQFSHSKESNSLNFN